jgi:hypothetical protein
VYDNRSSVAAKVSLPPKPKYIAQNPQNAGALALLAYVVRRSVVSDE